MKLMENSTCPFSATFDNVGLEKEVYNKTKLILSEQAASAVQKKWRVVSKGPDCKVVNIGDFIMFNSATAGEIEWDGGKKYVVLPEKDIVAIIR